MLEAPSLFSPADEVERVWSSVEFDTLWVFGSPSDTLLSEVLPHFAYEAVVGKDRVFTIEGGGMYPRIVALVRRASSAGQGGA